MALPALIGRDRELKALEQALQAATDCIGGCILLSGEAGIGKSRLAAELRLRAAADRFVILAGHCFEQDSSFPYAPWMDALRAFLATKNPAEIAELLGPLASEVVKLLPELALLLPWAQPSPALDPPAERYRLFESLARLIASLAAVHPFLIVLEDLHWSDDQSLAFLDFIARRIAALPILILSTYRSEDLSPRLAPHLVQLTREHLATEIELAPLARPAVAQLAQTILGTERPLSPDWLDRLMPLTEGNPFFVEEMAKALAETGAWQNAPLDLRLPRRLQDMVQRRVEQLPESARRILSLAAVIGERFDFGLLQEVSGLQEPDLLRTLKALIAARLIVEETADQFAFRHALTREAVYALPLQRERKALHQAIGETLERSVGSQAEAAAPQLAYHFYHAGSWDKAIQYSQRAGERARALYAQPEALSHFTHGLEAARQLGLPPPRVALRGRAQAYEASGEFALALADFEAALDRARREADPAAEWQARIDLGFLWQSRDLERAGEYFREALALARRLNESPRLAHSLNRIGNWYLNRGHAREALPYHQEALALFVERADRQGMAHTLDLLGIVSFVLGEAIQGAAYLEQALPLLRELDDRQGLVNTLTNLAFRAPMDTEVLGEIDFRQLANLCDEAQQIARGIHWSPGEALTLIQAALSLKQAGEYGQALERLGRAQAMAAESQNRESFARLHLTFGEIFVELLDLTEALPHLETALAALQELGSGVLTASATARLASAALLQNDLARARALLTGLLPAEYPEGQEPFPQRLCWSARAELELMDGRPRRALEIIDRLLAATPNLAQSGHQAVPQLARLRAQALAALGQPEEASLELQGALLVARRQGRRPLLWRLHAQLGQAYRALGRRGDAQGEFASARTVIGELAAGVPEGALRDNFSKQALAALPAVPTPTARQAAKKDSGGLTAREREVAALVARGKLNREIADELVISDKTVERHIANILSKLGFKSRTQLAVWAAERVLGK